MSDNRQRTLSRDVTASQIPSGDKHTLFANTSVFIHQVLGGSYTVQTDTGLYRLDGKDADAIGETVKDHQVKGGTAYPAVLFSAGMNDARIDPWHAGKMAARLQAANPGGKPVLLRVDFEAGHGPGTNRRLREQEVADVYAFLLWQFGVPEFQPPVATPLVATPAIAPAPTIVPVPEPVPAPGTLPEPELK